MSIAKCLPLLPEMNHWQTWKAKKLGSAQNISNVLPSLRHKTGLAMSFFEIGQNCLTFKKEQPWAKTVKQNKLIILFVGHCLHCAICCFAFLIAGCWLTCSTVSSRLTSVIEFASHAENNALFYRLSCLSISTVKHLCLSFRRNLLKISFYICLMNAWIYFLSLISNEEYSILIVSLTNFPSLGLTQSTNVTIIKKPPADNC